MDTVSKKFRSKKNGCVLSALPHSDIIPLQILLLSYINIGEERQGTHMKKNYESVYRMKLTGYQVRTAIGILNERRLALKSQGCTLENSEEYVGVFNLLSRFLDLLPA